MIELTPISITATAHQYMMALSEGVCPPQCVNSSNQPLVSITAATKEISNPDGAVAHVTTKISGTITWTPANGCNAIVKQFNETIVDGFAGTAVPTVAYALGTTPVLALRKFNCCSNYANGVVITLPITITATFPAA